VPDDYKQKHKMIISLIRSLITSTGSVKITAEQSLEHLVGIFLKDHIVKYFTTEQSHDQIASCESPSPIQMVTYQGSKDWQQTMCFFWLLLMEISPDPTKIADYESVIIVGLTRVKRVYVRPKVMCMEKKSPEACFCLDNTPTSRKIQVSFQE
jgi:hypothetical protein